MGVPVIFKNKIAYGYAEKSVQAYDISVSDYNALTEQQQLDGSIRFIQGVNAIPNGNNVWAKLGTTPLAEGLPRDCSQAINELKSNLTELQISEIGDSISLTANVDYTTLSDGYFVISFNGGDVYGNHYVYATVNGVRLMSLNSPKTVATYGYENRSIFVRKGSVIKFEGDSIARGVFRPLIDN